MTEVGIFYQLLKPTSLRRCSTVSPVNPWNPISWRKQGHYAFANAINVLTRNTTEQFTVTPQFSTTGLTTFHTLPWTASKLIIRTERLLIKVATEHPYCLKNCSQGEVEKLGKLVCRCGHLNYLEPMEFSRLVCIHRRTALWWSVNRFNMFSPQSHCIQKCCDLFFQ